MSHGQRMQHGEYRLAKCKPDFVRKAERKTSIETSIQKAHENNDKVTLRESVFMRKTMVTFITLFCQHCNSNSRFILAKQFLTSDGYYGHKKGSAPWD
jgi:hypothetical protein